MATTRARFLFVGPPHRDTGVRGHLPLEVDANLVNDSTFDLDDYLRRVVQDLMHGHYGYWIDFDECEQKEAPE